MTSVLKDDLLVSLLRDLLGCNSLLKDLDLSLESLSADLDNSSSSHSPSHDHKLTSGL